MAIFNWSHWTHLLAGVNVESEEERQVCHGGNHNNQSASYTLHAVTEVVLGHEAHGTDFPDLVQRNLVVIVGPEISDMVPEKLVLEIIIFSIKAIPM